MDYAILVGASCRWGSGVIRDNLQNGLCNPCRGILLTMGLRSQSWCFAEGDESLSGYYAEVCMWF